ncbi:MULTISPECIES: MBL fold metallo-hydrolase [Saccharothrix]|uniref:MBL fold metallo-hydrolase n=1 Tax=Saccharothrix TaxID=2071 RepID=UPI000939521B|nr:MBL fold metallo-hydrolase [Saccharothrix sp. CB00851]OKI23188.1 hypothetical protein A6A25_35270 [Saccharothrix sp. CB00851]
MTDGHWIDVADRVYARRYGELDLTVGLVVGDTGCLVVDSRGDVVQGAELAAAVRGITALPWTLVYTHAHFDHCFGPTPFLPCDVWAVVVPGHGEPVDAGFVARHRDGLVRLVELRDAVVAGEIRDSEAVARSAYPEDVTRALPAAV